MIATQLVINSTCDFLTICQIMSALYHRNTDKANIQRSITGAFFMLSLSSRIESVTLCRSKSETLAKTLPMCCPFTALTLYSTLNLLSGLSTSDGLVSSILNIEYIILSADSNKQCFLSYCAGIECKSMLWVFALEHLSPRMKVHNRLHSTCFRPSCIPPLS